MKRKTFSVFLALLFYASLLPWHPAPLYAAGEHHNYNIKNAYGDNTGRIKDVRFGNENYTDIADFYDAIIASGQYVDPRSKGYAQGASAATNRVALQTAFDCAALLGSGGIPVLIPGAAVYIDNTVKTNGVPFWGAGPERTEIFPTGSFPAFEISQNSGYSGNLTVNYTAAGAIDNNAVGFLFRSVSQCQFAFMTVWNGYRHLQKTDDGSSSAIWGVRFQNMISSGNKDWAFFLQNNGNAPGTGIIFSNTHVYAQYTTPGGKGLYAENITDLTVPDKFSIDGGDNTTLGAWITFLNGYALNIKVLYSEGFTQAVGGTARAPIYHSGLLNLGVLYVQSLVTDVGAGNDAYYIYSTYPSGIILSAVETQAQYAPVSGNRKIADVAGAQYGIVHASRWKKDHAVGFTQITRDLFNFGNVNPAQFVFVADRFYDSNIRENFGQNQIDNTTKVILQLPLWSGAYGPGGIFTVIGTRGGSSTSFADVLLISGSNTVESIKVIATDNVGVVGARTYSWASDNLSMTIADAYTYYTRVHGTATYSFYPSLPLTYPHSGKQWEW